MELVVEVVSQSNHSKDTTQMPGWYAGAGIPLFLLIDPRNGTRTLFSRPDGTRYVGESHGRFGDTVELPEPFGFPLETGLLPLYGPRP